MPVKNNENATKFNYPAGVIIFAITRNNNRINKIQNNYFLTVSFTMYFI